MEVSLSATDEQALTLVLDREELRLLRAALERASFLDVAPELQARAVEFAQELLARLDDATRD